jgi:hypothetical protein
MKKSICLVSCLLALTLTSTFGQQPASPPRTTPFPQPGITPTPASSELTKFNLDFPGGTPKELVAAIQKATGKPLNAIIQDEDADTKLPSLKMSDVNIAQLFQALETASSKQVRYETSPGGSYQFFKASSGFKTDGKATDNSIWHFYADKPAPPLKNQPVLEAPALTKFNLDFPGGTPKQLATALEKAIGKPLNIVISDKDAGEKLPPLKMSNVDLLQFSRAFTSANLKQEFVYLASKANRGPGNEMFDTGVAFRLSPDEKPSDNSMWYFNVQRVPPPAPPEKASRFYQLSPYLDNGYTVDDITTAIQTGWKMQGDTSPPEISFHKETKLLIAVGEPRKLLTIDAVLEALNRSKPKAPASKPAEQPKPAQQ